MSKRETTAVLPGFLRGERPADVFRRGTIIGVVAFLTLIDLFGSQALLPRLVVEFEVDAATMGLAVNASTIGMAVSGLGVAYFSDRIDRKRGIWLSLALLSVPTFLLGVTDDTTAFTLLRIMQGVCMAAAFTLTMTYLSEGCDRTAAAGAMAAYIAGNVASNLFGRLMAASLADWISLSGSFYAFSALNLAGAAFAYRYIGASSGPRPVSGDAPLAAWAAHLRAGPLRASFLIGFLLLFVFVGAFTYVNFELVGPRFDLPADALGLVYFVFLPSLFTTLVAGRYARRYGTRPVFWASAAVACIGLGLSLTPSLAAFLLGMALIGVGAFFAQAATTGYVGRAAGHRSASANGLYLSSYYLGGLVGALAVGQVYAALGWPAAVLLLALGMVAAGVVALGMVDEAA